ELLGKTMDDLFPSDLAKSMIADDLRILNEGKLLIIEEEFNGRFYETSKFPILIDGKPKYLAGYTIDLTIRRQAEQALKEREKELETKTINLEEVNAALKVLLKRREEDKKELEETVLSDKKELEETVLSNIKELISPYIEKFKISGLNTRQINLLSVIESNLNDIVIPFSRHMSMKYSNLTPKEIQVAGLVKDGKTTKEIAEMLNSSTSAINFHRNNLRQKLGLKNKKTNLRSHLLSFM
ncbi:MAG: PAS domain-containing protein, partial [Deltaproteobacteria bacterium]|nr:PAS domain-containing protein [Deltaproteobacteria bacterium]